MVHRTDRRMGVEGRMLPLPALSSPGETCCKLPVGPGQGCAPRGAQCHGTEQREGTWEPPAQGDLGPRRADVSGPLTLQVLGEVTAVTVRGIRWCQPKVPGDDTPGQPQHLPPMVLANRLPTPPPQQLASLWAPKQLHCLAHLCWFLGHHQTPGAAREIPPGTPTFPTSRAGLARVNPQPGHDKPVHQHPKAEPGIRCQAASGTSLPGRAPAAPSAGSWHFYK